MPYGICADCSIGALLREKVRGCCCGALKAIREILDDGHLGNAECLSRIEEMVATHERLGPKGGSRHDFG
ncbi:hypothetical protein [Dysosmobacter sp.]